MDPVVLTLGVAAAALVLFITELIPPDITALASAAALMVLGVLTPAQGLAGFSNEATITVLSMFILAAAVQRTGLVNVMAHKVLAWARGSPLRFLVLLVLFAGGVSAFLNNTPIVAMLIPLVVTVAARLKRSASKFLIPLSFAAMLGGTMTLIGTSTNLLASSFSERLGYGAFSMFMFTKVGAVVFLVGIAYLVLIGRHLLPERTPAGAVEERFQLRDYVCEVVVGAGSPLVGQTVERSDLKRRFDIDIIRIFRGAATIDQPLVGVTLREGDVLLIRASRDELLNIRETEGLAILPEVRHGLPGPSDEMKLVEAIIAPGSDIEGMTLPEARFRQRYDLVVLAIKKRERLFLRRLQTLRIEPGDSLLLMGSIGAIEALKQSPHFIVTDEPQVERFRRRHIPVAVAILAGVVVVSTAGWYPVAVAALAGAVLMFATGCLKVHELQEAVRLDIVFLLAGLIPLGIALQETGAAALLASLVARAATGLPPILTLALVYLVTMVLTEFMSNNAAVVLMMPVSAQIAERLGLNAMTFILVVTFASSLAFMTPMGYQTNLMVYGPGEYRFSDYLRVGAPLNLISLVLSVWLVDMWWPLESP